MRLIRETDKTNNINPLRSLIVKPLNFRSAIEEWRSLLRHDLQYRFAKESGGACA